MVKNLKIQKAIKSDTVEKILNLSAVILFGIIFASLIISMMGGTWKSPWIWLITVSFAALLLWYSYRIFDRKMAKRIGVCVLISFMLVIPVFVTLSAIEYHSVAQLIAAEHEIAYFKSVLDRSYDYKELIGWEWQHIEWLNNSEPNSLRNTDPIRIFEYGQGKCMEFAILYAELCISQGYECRIIAAPLNDHAWTEVKIYEEWTRVDSSLGPNDTRGINYPLFFEKEENWSPPVIALAFEDSSIVDVTSVYRSDGWSFFSLINILFVVFALWFSFCGYLILKKHKSVNRT